MKYAFRPQKIILVVVFCSMLSALYLEFHGSEVSQIICEKDFVQACIKETSYLPDVKLVKELLRSIFNVVNAAV